MATASGETVVVGCSPLRRIEIETTRSAIRQITRSSARKNLPPRRFLSLRGFFPFGAGGATYSSCVCASGFYAGAHGAVSGIWISSRRSTGGASSTGASGA